MCMYINIYTHTYIYVYISAYKQPWFILIMPILFPIKGLILVFLLSVFVSPSSKSENHWLLLSSLDLLFCLILLCIILKPSGCHPTCTPSLWFWPLPGFLPTPLGMHCFDKNLKRKKISSQILQKGQKINCEDLSQGMFLLL